MVEIKSKTTAETEQVVGKNVIENIKTIEKAVGNILKDNLYLRRIEIMPDTIQVEYLI